VGGALGGLLLAVLEYLSTLEPFRWLLTLRVASATVFVVTDVAHVLCVVLASLLASILSRRMVSGAIAGALVAPMSELIAALSYAIALPLQSSVGWQAPLSLLPFGLVWRLPQTLVGAAVGAVIGALVVSIARLRSR
jgi:hypothetical protein